MLLKFKHNKKMKLLILHLQISTDNYINCQKQYLILSKITLIKYSSTFFIINKFKKKDVSQNQLN